jgi:ATP-dependent exoDNAse (exonuclease V) alpha subunit
MFPLFRKAIKEADILLIDEISMLHDFRLDMVERIVREVRRNDDPFGGLQVILSGDFFQLPPINRSGQTFGGFITESKIYKDEIFSVCYLDKIQRQIEGDALNNILNSLRCNTFGQDQQELLWARAHVNLDNDTVSELYCTNIGVDQRNQEELDNLPGEAFFYTQQISGINANAKEELRRVCSAVPNLSLKNGAVVMFNKNDPQKRFFNGSLGKIVGFNPERRPTVKLNNGKIVDVEPAEWYLEDGEGMRLATIWQLPLRLAWAITVHKCQGMTLDAARIDLSNAFVEGIGYVALSRVRSINNLSLIGWNNMARRVSSEALRLEQQLQKDSKEAEKCIYPG